jgi:tripartite-type tricarboxylate transporter receptor subunit TctC
MVSKRGIFVVLIGFLLLVIIVGGYKMHSKMALQEYPSKPITVIVPFCAGGTADIIVRRMEGAGIKYINQPMVINNIPGGGGTIGWNKLIEATDGYTIGYVGTSALLQPLYGQVKYHYPTALEPLVQVSEAPALMVVSADSPWNTLNDVSEYAKAHPGEVKFAHPGIGTALHIVGELFTKNAALDIAQVPFQGDSESIAALLGGHVQIVFTTLPSIIEPIRAGKVKVLAVSGEKRLTSSECNSVPTFTEQGLDIIYTTWHGIGVPKNMPKPIQQKLAKVFEGIANDPDFQNKMQTIGLEVKYLGQEEFMKKWSAEANRLAKITRETGVADKIAAQKK